MITQLLRSNLKLARSRWKFELIPIAVQLLKSLTDRYQFSIAEGDLIWLEGGWYVTHTGLVRLANRNRCAGIHTKPAAGFCDPQTQRWSFEATFTSLEPVGASSAMVMPIHPMFLPLSAAPRCGWPRREPSTEPCARPTASASARSRRSEQFRIQLKSSLHKRRMANGNGNGSGPKVRDRLCQLIRQHKLDPELVKAYAVDFCGTKTLRDATREQVENFVQDLADWAEKDRNALLCQLNSYERPKQEVVA